MGLDFPKTRGDWKFDLVGLLAIIGESIIDEIVQPLTASRTILLPRLLPAPHALIRPSRRAVLPSTDVTVVGIYSGIHLQSVPYFPSMLHQFDLIRPYEFQEITIEFIADEEEGPLRKHNQLATVRTFAPLKLITIGSSLWTAGILIWAIILHDGPAVVAIVLVSLASSFHSAASFWRSYVARRHTPFREGVPGDLALRTREGALILVHCDEEVARLLYSGEARCTYVAGATAYRILIYAGTLFLMMGIVLMSNCSWSMQVTLGASYLALNVAYMFCALTPEVSRGWHWDLRWVKVVRSSTVEAANYTDAIWHAIRTTKSVDWIKKANFVPATPNWDGWLNQAKENCNNPNWDAVSAKDRWMTIQLKEKGDEAPSVPRQMKKDD